MINFNAKSLIPKCEEFGLVLTAEAADRLEAYGNLLLEWNEKFNLTAITEPGEVLYKHFYDCLLFFSAADVKNGAKIIDVGAGAGFPSVVLKIARTDIDITMLDSLNKRVTFLNEVLKRLCLFVWLTFMCYICKCHYPVDFNRAYPECFSGYISS